MRLAMGEFGASNHLGGAGDAIWECGVSKGSGGGLFGKPFQGVSYFTKSVNIALRLSKIGMVSDEEFEANYPELRADIGEVIEYYSQTGNKDRVARTVPRQRL